MRVLSAREHSEPTTERSHGATQTRAIRSVDTALQFERGPRCEDARCTTERVGSGGTNAAATALASHRRAAGAVQVRRCGRAELAAGSVVGAFAAFAAFAASAPGARIGGEADDAGAVAVGAIGATVGGVAGSAAAGSARNRHTVAKSPGV